MSGVVLSLGRLLSLPLWTPLGYYGSALEPVALVPEASWQPESGGAYAPPLAHLG